MLPEHKSRVVDLIEQASAGLGLSSPCVVRRRGSRAWRPRLQRRAADRQAAQENPREIGRPSRALKANPAAQGLLDRWKSPARVSSTCGLLPRQSRRLQQRADSRRDLRYGDAYAGRKVMVEFVSANPTGPLHLGHARQAALGDALANLLAAQEAEVAREFYYNDAGAQIDTWRSRCRRVRETQRRGGRVSAGRLSRRIHRRDCPRIPGAQDDTARDVRR